MKNFKLYITSVLLLSAVSLGQACEHCSASTPANVTIPNNVQAHVENIQSVADRRDYNIPNTTDYKLKKNTAPTRNIIEIEREVPQVSVRKTISGDIEIGGYYPSRASVKRL